jgi:hypothetical protein
MSYNKELEESINEVMNYSNENIEFKRRFANIIKNAIDDNYINNDIVDLINLITLQKED